MQGTQTNREDKDFPRIQLSVSKAPSGRLRAVFEQGNDPSPRGSTRRPKDAKKHSFAKHSHKFAEFCH